MKRKSLKYGIPAVFILYAVFNLYGERLCAQPYNETVKEAVTTHYDRGRDYFCKKDYMAAKDEFEKVLALTPGHSGAQWYLSIIKKELGRQQKSFWNCLEGAEWIKEQENNREENLESALTTIEKKLPAEKADAGRQIEKEKAGLVKQLEEYETEARKSAEHERLAVRKIAGLEQEKQHLETDIEEYKRLLASRGEAGENRGLKQQISQPQNTSTAKELSRLQKLEQEKEELNAQLKKLRQEQEKQLKVAEMRQQADQEELLRLKKVEAEKEKLAGQISQIRSEQKDLLQEKLNEYKTALREKFDQQVAQFNQRLADYENRLGQVKKEKEELEKKNQNADTQNVQLSQAQKEKDRLEAELKAVQQAHQAQLDEELNKYEDTFKKYELSLRDNFERKIDELNAKIAEYESRLKRYENESAQLQEEKNKLEEEHINTEKQNLQLQMLEKEKEEIQVKLEGLRTEQKVCVQDELKKYEQSLQNILAQKEYELEEKVKNFESRMTQSRPKEGKDDSNDAETKLLQMQAQLNEQLRAQLGAFQKEKAAPFYEQGRVYVRKKEYILARESLERALSIYPDYAEAKNVINNVETLEKIDLLIAEGEHYFNEGEYQKAGEEFTQAVTLDYKNLKARNYIHKIEAELKRQERAEQELAVKEQREQEAKLREEERRQAEEARQAQLKEEKERQAKQKLAEEKSLRDAAQRREEEQSRLAMLKLAEIKAEQEAKQKREAQQQKIKEDIRLHLAQGKVLYCERNYEQAIKEFKDILILEPKDAIAEKYIVNCQRAIEKQQQEVLLTARREEKCRAEEARQAQINGEREQQAKQRLAEKESLRDAAQRREEEKDRLSKLKLAEIQAEREAQQKKKEDMRLHLAQGKVYYCEENYAQAIEEFKDILIIDSKNTIAEKYIVNCQKAMEKQQQEALLSAQKEKERQAEAARQAQLKAAQEERAKQELAAKEKREQEAKLREEERRQAEEARQAQLKEEKERQARQRLAEKESLRDAAQRREEEKRQAEAARQAQLKAAQEERAKQELAAKEKREQEAKLREEEKRQAEAARQAQLKSAQEERAKQELAAKEKREQEARLKEEEKRQSEATRQAELKAAQEERAKQELAAEEKRAKQAQAEQEKRREEARLKEEEQRKAREKKLAKRDVDNNYKEKIRLHFAQGKINFYRKEYEQAMKEFGSILLLDPEHSAAEKFIQRCRQALDEQNQETLQVKEEQAGKLEKAAKLIKEDEEKEKLEKIEGFYKKGKNFYRCGLYSEAIACFEQVVELEGNPRLYYTPQAKEYIKKSKVKAEGKKKEAARQIAEEEVKRIKSEKEKDQTAERKTRKEALPEKEEAARNHYKSGKNYYAQGSYPLAIAEFNKIKEIAPEHIYVAYAEEYIQKARQKIIQKEEKELKAKMRRQGPEIKGEVTAENLLQQARWYYKRGDYQQTVKICRAALELDPVHKGARSLLYKADVKQIRRQDKRANKEKAIDEKEMMADVAQTQVLPVDKTIKIKEKEFLSFVKVPAVKEKLKNPITVDFRDVDLSYVLNFLADSTGVNVIPASGVSLEGKKVTIKMKDIPAEKALKYILKNQGLTYRLEEDAVWVASASEMDKEEVESRVYFLNRGSGMFTEFERTVAAGTGLGGAATISKITTIEDTLKAAVDWPQNSKLVLDERSGALIVANTPSNLQLIEDILYNLDITPIQVLIEARFVELEITDVKQLGIEWQITEDTAGGRRYQGENATQFESGAGWDFTDSTRSAEGINLTYTGVLSYPQFQMVLHALAETQDAKTLSAPRVTTLNNQMATIKVVDEWIYPTKYEFQVVQSDVNGDGDFDDANETKYQNVPVDFVTKDVGILLHVTPNIGGDAKTITLALVPEVSSGTAGYFSYTGSVSLPLFTSRTLSTSVVINNGETVALGGLVKETTTKTKTKIPLLGDVPILGNLFKKSSDSVVRKNLLIFVTATIISPSGEKIETVHQ